LNKIELVEHRREKVSEYWSFSHYDRITERIQKLVDCDPNSIFRGWEGLSKNKLRRNDVP
tara:strand:+ start:298 stop:477 length:180 start_codon:yes stop_codon:yes gene_type:complete